MIRVRSTRESERACSDSLLGLALWFFGFYVLGGEWFVSWQSTEWSSTQAGLQLTVLILVLLIFLTGHDTEEQP